VFGGDPAPIEQLGEQAGSRPAAPPPPTPPPSAAQALPPDIPPDISPLAEYVPPEFRARLAALHAQQARLAQGDDDAAYERCLKNLAALRAEIEAAKNGEAA
jgi:hypothetical protein